MTFSDEHLISEIQLGGKKGEQAIKVLYEQCFYLVRNGRSSYRQLDDEDLMSAYNSAVIAVRKQILNGAFRAESALSTYLQKIFSNRAIDIIRSKSSNKEKSVEYLPDQPDTRHDLLSTLIQKEELTLVREKLKQLGEICSKILHYSVYMGYSALEIAETIGFSNANSVNSKKYSCLQQLRELLKT
ncbi:MAG: sigma-70 family RNA polymerase sigma factor [Saprospiraceae bacterium]|nr:sigma-70 family RNA polymerase sigma factor [Saprospiraceae bacterium]MCB9345310.1 sigma-70 family RNA polymerase sigma factor [Lewinellaceae bacterium]